MQIEVDKSVPLPEPKLGRPKKYPFAEMEVGDSFFVPQEKVRSASKSASMYKAAHGGDFTRRSVEGGVRIWRVE